MIELHTIGREGHTYHLNPDLILTAEATPDTVIALTTGARVIVEETPQQVADAVRAYRVQILEEALRRKR